MEISKLTWKEIENLPKDTVFFISISPLEAHGPHLPVSTDLEISKRIEKATIESVEKHGIKCVSLPSLNAGVCKHLQGFPGTLSLRWKIVYEMLLDIFYSFAEYGFKYFVIISFHMDLFHLKALHKAIKKARKRGIKACEPISAYYFRKELFERNDGEIHADVNETSLALYLFPEMVGNYDIKDFKIKFNLINSLKNFREIGADDAYIGSPRNATAEYGEKLFNKIVEKCTQSTLFLREGKITELPKKIKVLLGI